MSLHDLAVAESRIVKRRDGVPVIWIVVVFLAGVVTACLVSGCNTVVQGVNGMAKDALIAAAAVKASTDGGLGGKIPGPDSMALDAMPNGDQAVTWTDVERIRKQYGL